MTIRQSQSGRVGCSVSIYDRKAVELVRQYESVRFEDVHKDIIDLIPPQPIRILDVGAGSGRDASALAARGHHVTAVEPSAGMRELAKSLHATRPIAWIDDCLPALSSLQAANFSFDFVLISAVWMHLKPAERDLAAARIANLLVPGGLLVVTLRHGPTESDRGIYDISDSELINIAKGNGLALVRQLAAADTLKRDSVFWSTLVFAKTKNEKL